eukprot:SAG31_NODE_2020_length_6659_cov_1.685976_7_plen_88_part_00
MAASEQPLRVLDAVFMPEFCGTIWYRKDHSVLSAEGKGSGSQENGTASNWSATFTGALRHSSGASLTISTLFLYLDSFVQIDGRVQH